MLLQSCSSTENIQDFQGTFMLLQLVVKLRTYEIFPGFDVVLVLYVDFPGILMLFLLRSYAEKNTRCCRDFHIVFACFCVKIREFAGNFMMP